MTDTKIDRESVERMAQREQSENDYLLRQLGYAPRASRVSETLLALRAALDAAEAENKRLRRAALDATAHLVAATSLLRKGGKKAAPSNKMFEQMLLDYEATIKRARAALQENPDG